MASACVQTLQYTRAVSRVRPQPLVGISREACDELVRLLLACESVRDSSNRDLVLRRLDSTISARIPEATSLLTTVEQIVTTCNGYEEGISGLLAAVAFYEGDSNAMKALRNWRARMTEQVAEQAAKQTNRPEENRPETNRSEDDERVKDRPEARGPLWGVPELPPHFLARPDDAAQLVAALCANERQHTGITGAGKHGLYGMGGLGKSVLAAAIARDSAIRAHFTDGVYWLTVGQTPSLAVLQSRLGRAVGMASHVFASLADGKQALSDYLAEKRILLVLDDVWRTDHAAWLEVMGERGRLLITTRNLDVLSWRSAVAHSLDILAIEQACSLLADWTDSERETLPDDAARVAEACGRLPLALAIAGALVRRPGGSWSRVLQMLQRAQLKKLRSQEPTYPYRNVYQVIEASVTQMVQDGDAAAIEACFVALAVFAEDDEIPEDALRVLWRAHGVEDEEVAEVASMMATYALVRMRAVDPFHLRLHDIQRAYVQARTDDIPARHGLFVDAFAERCENGLASGPDEGRGYFYRRLPYHLIQAGRLHQLRTLLGSYEWLDAKLREVGVVALLADFDDFERARSRAERDNQGASEPELWLAPVRDALRLSSHILGNDREQLPSQLLGRLQHVENRGPVLEALLAETSERRERPWLRPLVTALTRPGGPLLRTLTGHTDWVKSVALNSAGWRAVSGSDDRTIKVWDTLDGQLLHTLSGHTGAIWSVAMNAAGTRALSGSDDGTVKFWDVVDGALLSTFDGHANSIGAVALSTGGTRALSGGADQTVKLWDTLTGEVLQEFSGHTQPIRAVALSADNKLALSGCAGGALLLFDTETGEHRCAMQGHRDSINALAMSRDGALALSGASDGTVKLWNLATGALLRDMGAHELPVMAVAMSADGELALSGSQDCTIRLWSLADEERSRQFDGHADAVRALAMSENGVLVLSGSSDNTLKLWDAKRDASQQSLALHAGAIASVALSADGSLAATGSSDRTVKLVEVATGRLLGTFVEHGDAVNAVALSVDGTRGVSGSDDTTAMLWDPSTGNHLLTIDDHPGPVGAVAIDRHGTRVLAGSSNGALRLWDANSGDLVHNLEGHTGSVDAVALTPDGTRALSGSSDNTVRLWNGVTGALLRTFHGHALWISAVALSEDGRHALAGSSDGSTYLWDTETGELLATTMFHKELVRSVVLSSDGQYAVSGSDDRKVVYWHTQHDDRVATFVADAAIGACALAFDDAGVIVAGDELGGLHALEFVGLDDRRDSGSPVEARPVRSLNTTLNGWSPSKNSKLHETVNWSGSKEVDLARLEQADEQEVIRYIRTRITRIAKVQEQRSDRTSSAYLVLIYPPGAEMGRRYTCSGDELVLGRGVDVDILLDRDSVSRRHARVYRAGDRWRIQDLNSTNGSYVNGEPVADSSLTDGDEVRVGSVILKFMQGEDIEASYYEEIYRMAIIDALTKAYNQRYLFEFLDRELSRAVRHRRPLSLVLFDIDHFKKVNDTQGHLTGDHVLHEIAQRLLGRVRMEEILARYGGEEFAVVLPETGHEAAMKFGEQISQRVAGDPFEYDGETFYVTVSVGVYTMRGESLSVEEFLRLADENVTLAKQSGRNRVVGTSSSDSD